MPGPVFGAGDAPLKPGALSLKPTSSFLKWFSGPWPFQLVPNLYRNRGFVSRQHGTRSLCGGRQG